MIEDELLAAVAASPNDDGPRLVYADWLQQQPDEVRRVRGEYIALACTTVRPKPTARLQELVDRHAAAWLGPIATVTDPGSWVWSRGFLDGAAFAHRSPGPTDIEPVLEHREWRVLRMLEAYTTTPIPNDKLARMICQRSLANLRALSARISVLSSIAESANAPRITELAVNQSVHEPVAGVVPLLAADCFARLRRLHVSCSASMLSALMRPGLALIVTSRPRSLLDWIAELVAQQAPLVEMRLVRDSHRMFERRGMELVLHHAGAAWNHLEVRWSYEDDAKWRDELIASLRRLPTGAVQRLSFVGPSAARFDTVRFKQRVTGVIPTAVVE